MAEEVLWGTELLPEKKNSFRKLKFDNNIEKQTKA